MFIEREDIQQQIALRRLIHYDNNIVESNRNEYSNALNDLGRRRVEHTIPMVPIYDDLPASQCTRADWLLTLSCRLYRIKSSRLLAVICDYFFIGYSYDDIAERYGLTPRRVRQLVYEGMELLM